MDITKVDPSPFSCGQTIPEGAEALKVGYIVYGKRVGVVRPRLYFCCWDCFEKGRHIKGAVADKDPLPLAVARVYLSKKFGSKFPILVVLEGKHDTQYLYAADLPALRRAWLRAFKIQEERGWYRELSDEASSPFLAAPSYTEEQAADLKGSARVAALEEIQEYEQHRRQLEVEQDPARALYLKAKAGDEFAARELLVLRSEYEYEGCREESVEAC